MMSDLAVFHFEVGCVFLLDLLLLILLVNINNIEAIYIIIGIKYLRSFASVVHP